MAGDSEGFAAAAEYPSRKTRNGLIRGMNPTATVGPSRRDDSQSRSDFMMVAVGFNPRFTAPAEYPSRSDG